MNPRHTLFALLLISVAAAPAGADSIRTVQFLGTAQGSVPMINNLGEVAYTTYTPGSGVYRAMSEPGGILSIAIASGNHAPGLPSGTNISSLGNVYPDSAGRAGFSAYVTGSVVAQQWRANSCHAPRRSSARQCRGRDLSGAKQHQPRRFQLQRAW
jgi:hypothetical protein